MPRHLPTLYAHLEQDSSEGLEDDGAGGSQVSTPSLHRQMSYNVPSNGSISSVMNGRPRQRLKGGYSPQLDNTLASSPPSRPGRATAVYAQFVNRYRRPNSFNDPAAPDDYYEPIVRPPGQLYEEDNDDDRPGSSHSFEPGGRYSSPILDPETYEPASEAERERLEWQSMLASVLDGEVLKSEKSRIHDTLASFDSPNNRRLMEIWVGLRAKLRHRQEEDEAKRLEERKLHVVDRVIDEILSFRVADGSDTASASHQVNRVLRQLDKMLSFYPTRKAFEQDKPLATSDDFKSRCDALYTWTNVLESLRLHINLLRRWTGNDNLDVSHYSTFVEHDRASFLERILKSESIQKTFEKRALVDVRELVSTARDAQVNLSAIFRSMNLPAFEEELVHIISFPTRLVHACLRVRLDAAQRFTNPDVLSIDQMLIDFRLTIGLACTLKREYREFQSPDPDGNWNLPDCIPEEYDTVLLQALDHFFKLIHWKLSAGSKDMFFRDTEVLKEHEETFNDVSLAVDRGATRVAEQLCAITNKVINKATNAFEKQIRIPILARDKPKTLFTPPQASNSPSTNGVSAGFDFQSRFANVKGRVMSGPQMIGWYEKVFESVKTRYRKLATHSRALIQRYGNSADYSLESVQMDAFIACLVESDHFLVYTQSYEEDGTYIIGSRGLRGLDNQVEVIKQLLQDPFHVKSLWRGGYRSLRHSGANGEVDLDLETLEDSQFEDCAYLLILSPRVRFLWNGPVLMLQLPRVELDLNDNVVRLVADGPDGRLALAKERFTECFVLVDEDGEAVESYTPAPTCIVEKMAHLPVVNRQLWAIARKTDRLAEAIVEAVFHIKKAVSGVTTSAELLYNWYYFATEHGQQAQKYMNRPSWMRYNQLLIRLAISWVSFICDDCDPQDKRTFKWAVAALEFAMLRTRRSNILHLPDEQFDLLRQKVASCMSLLIAHYDILGARATFAMDAKRERDKMLELRKMGFEDRPDNDEDLWEIQTPANDGAGYPDYMAEQVAMSADRSVRRHRDEILQQLRKIDEGRVNLVMEQHLIGRVLDEQKPEDQSLMDLASSSSSVQIRWQQGKFVGAGAFGSVYTAVNLDTATVMAVKEIRVQEVSGSPNLYKHIRDELKVMEMLHHPNIVEFYGIEVHRDRVYIFEEYCEGGTLAKNLEVGRITDEHIIQVYTMQMLEGLVYLHSRSIVHRDIKPENILLDHLGVLKFVDFGASKVIAKATNTRVGNRTRLPAVQGPAAIIKGANVKGADENGGLGKPNSLTGTPMYMSPEIIKNDLTGRHGAMDIWSMGCVVLECATGRKPWSNLDNEWAIMFHIGVATQHPPLPDKHELSELGIDFIKQCLTIDAMQRPSAEELMQHQWIQQFIDSLRDYEEEELATSPPADMPSEQDYTGATVARQAAILQEKETEAIVSSPPASESGTPGSSVGDSSDAGAAPQPVKISV